MNPGYKEFKPSLALRPYIDRFWIQEYDGFDWDNSVQRCIPSGLTQLIIHINRQAGEGLKNGVWKQLPDAFFVGLHKQPEAWRCKGRLLALGASIKPEAQYALLGIPACTLLDDYKDLGSVLESDAERLCNAVYGNEDPNYLIATFEAYFQNRLKGTAYSPGYLAKAAQTIRETKGAVSIESLSNCLGISYRQLQRTFRDSFGMTPKLYARVVRFSSAYSYVRDHGIDRLNWLDISYHYGYSDQSHFIREFKQFAGFVPTGITFDDTQFYLRMG